MHQPNPDGSGQQHPGNGSSMSLNVHLAVPQQPNAAQAAQEGGHTPNTPEILNSIVNMQSGPFAAYASVASSTSATARVQTSQQPTSLINMGSPADSISHGSPSPLNHGSTSDSPVSTPSSTMSVQHYRSQFIKEGLKMKVRQNLGVTRSRLLSGDSSCSTTATMADFLDMPACSAVSVGSGSRSVRSNSGSLSPGPLDVSGIKQEELTEEDELRRLRRRERNKVAATKCRNKKKHRTQLLMKESDILDAQNRTLKSEIVKLEVEKKRLMEILHVHEPVCAKRLRLMQQQQQQEDSFRMPAPPTLAGVSSRSSSSSQPSNNSLSNVQSRFVSAAAAAAAQGMMYQGFNADAFVQDIKPQIQLNDFPMSPTEEELEDADPTGNGGGSFMRTGSCSFDDVMDQQQHQSGGFLAKRPLVHSYLDLDSRCIAL